MWLVTSCCKDVVTMVTYEGLFYYSLVIIAVIELVACLVGRIK